MVRLDRIEQWVRRAGGIGAAIFLVVVYVGLWRASRHSKGRAIGPVPQILRGSFWLYLLAGVIGSGLSYLIWRPLRLTLSAPARLAALIVGALLYFPGLALMLWGRLALAEMYNVSSSLGAQLYANHRLVTTGPYTLVRHPMYVGGILAALGSALIYRTWFTLVVAGGLPVSLLRRARREEQVLAAEFGEQWAEYSRRVPAWLPRW